MIWWRPLKPAGERIWLNTDIMRKLEFKGLATIICAKMLFVPGFREIPANDRDHVRWWTV